MIRWEKVLNSLLVLTIAMVLLGSLALQFFHHEQPCPLCLLQRLCMLSVASAALFNIGFAPRKLHYGFMLIAAFCGGFIAARHVALNICSAAPFGEPFWGLSLYTWAFFIFGSTILAVAFFLMLFDKMSSADQPKEFKNWEWAPVALLFLVAVINIFAAWSRCGFSDC